MLDKPFRDAIVQVSARRFRTGEKVTPSEDGDVWDKQLADVSDPVVPDDVQLEEVVVLREEVMSLSFQPIGASRNEGFYSSGLEYEVSETCWECVVGDEASGLFAYARQLMDERTNSTPRIGVPPASASPCDFVRFLTLWEYASGWGPDTPDSPAEWESEVTLLGLVDLADVPVRPLPEPSSTST